MLMAWVVQVCHLLSFYPFGLKESLVNCPIREILPEGDHGLLFQTMYLMQKSWEKNTLGLVSLIKRMMHLFQHLQ